MGDLFDQLKSEGPLKKSESSPAKSSASSSSSPTKVNKHDKIVQNFDEKHKSSTNVIRRESLPSPLTVSSVSKKSKPDKARSLSPPKFSNNTTIKSLKVKLERKKLEEFLTRPLEEHTNNIRLKQEKYKNSDKQPKIMPTKAQQKQFEPSLGQKKTNTQLLKQYNVKPCKVRIHRDNLQKLAREFRKNFDKNKLISTKRSASSSPSDSPPSKKGKLSSAFDSKYNKMKNNFFFKFNASPNNKMDKKCKTISKNSYSSSSSSSSVAKHNKIKNSKFNTITTPTKFSRTQLISSFGKRFFNVQVKIERCTHPLMLTFESNDRARRLQAKRNNKSKNLSVSFREQVEIFGGSSDSDDSCDEDFCATTPNRNGRKTVSNQSKSVSATPVVMPARLKKVENGKVVDDIELDPSLFLDPKILGSSTPFSPGRKKRDHKSFSPLKDESSPSPRKEKLKLANERVPPTGLRRLNIDDEDDDDDDCEYIVPIEMPQRRASRTSSNTSLQLFDDDITNDNVDLAPFSTSALNLDKNNDVSNKNTEKLKLGFNLENGSEDSFQSAKDVVESRDNVFDKLQQTNGNGCNNESSKNLNTINTMEDISMNLFLEDSQTNDDTNGKSFVDSLINETIDKLSKDIEEGADTT